jgi:hypothetical protein
VQYDPQAGTYSLIPEQAFALTDPDGAVCMPGAFQLPLGTLRAQDQVTEAFRTGSGVGRCPLTWRRLRRSAAVRTTW